MKPALLVVSLLMLVAIPAIGEEPAFHEGAVMLTPPPGWARKGQGATAHFVAPDNGGSISIGSSQPFDTLDKTADALMAQAKSLPDFREEAKRTRGKHIVTGGEWLAITYSYADAARPGQFNYASVVIVAAGGRSVAVTATFATPDAFNRYKPAIGRMMDSVVLTSAIVVEPGKPPLTRFALDETEDFLEWLMQSPLTDGQKAIVETELRGCWKKNIRDEIDGMTKLLTARDQLAAMKPEQRELARQAILDAAIDAWGKDKTSAATKMMMDIYASSHQPIAQGSPPLTRQSVDAFAEFLCFAAGQTVGITVPLTAEMKEKLASEVAGGYAKLPAEQQKFIAGMPLLWAGVRAAWPELSEADRRKCIDGWKNDEKLVQLGNALKATQAISVATTSESPAAAQARLQAQQMNYQIMSNVMRMQYETNRAIISNIGGGGYRYEYRWR